jgi:hypothetical protein
MIILAAGKHHGKKEEQKPRWSRDHDAPSGYLKRREGDTLTPLPSFNNLASIPAVRDVLSDAAHISVSSNLLFGERDVNVTCFTQKRAELINITLEVTLRHCLCQYTFLYLR